MKQKLRSQSGMTLSEVLVAVVILALLATAVGAGLPVALKAHEQVSVGSEASVLCSTLATAITAELRYAQNPDPETDCFDSTVYGAGVCVQSDAGHVKIGGYELLSDLAYSSGLEAGATCNYDAGVFQVSVTVYSGGQQICATSFTVRPINAA